MNTSPKIPDPETYKRLLNNLRQTRLEMVDLLNPTQQRQVAGYTIEVFQDGNTLDVVSVPRSWVTLLPEIWGSSQVINLSNR